MPDRRVDGKSIRAAHGKWIMELQKNVEVIEQRLTLLESKVSTWESQLTERVKVQMKLDAELDSLRAELKRLAPGISKLSKGKKDEM